MALTYKTNAGAGDFEPVPAGSHIAVCDIVADIGLQPGSALFPKPKRQVYIRWQLPNERIDFEKDGKKQVGPAVVGKTYTASMNEKANLRHHLESWRGKQFTDDEAENFDVSAILGKPCMITVMHTQKGDRTYANISGIGPLPKGISAKTIVAEGNTLFYADNETANYKLLPEWLRKKIDGQISPPAVAGEPSQNGNNDAMEITDDDIPF